MPDKSATAALRRTPKFAVSARKSRADHITTEIVKAILHGELQPGDFVGTESTLAESFESSRLPVREALKRLGALGAVDVKTGVAGGARVAEANADIVAEVLAMQFALAGATTEEVLSARLAIEPIAVRIAAEHATEDDIQELYELVERAEHVTDQPEDRFPETAVSMLAIHSALVRASHNRALELMTSGLIQMLLQTYLQHGRSQRVAKKGLQLLRDVVDQIAARNADGAEQASRKHLEGQIRIWLKKKI